MASLWANWPGEAVGAKLFQDEFITVGNTRRHLSEFHVAASYEMLYFDISSQLYHFAPLHSYIFGAWAELRCLTVNVKAHLFGELLKQLEDMKAALHEKEVGAPEPSRLEEWQPDAFLAAYIVLPLAFLKKVALSEEAERRKFNVYVVSEIERRGQGFGYHRACGVLLDALLNPLAESEIGWQISSGVFDLPMRQATKVMKLKHNVERLLCQRLLDFVAGKPTSVQDLNLVLYGDVRL